jgi:hypothetical protein
VVDVFPDQVVERARGGAESSSAGVALTVEGVLIQMAATKTGTGRVEFSGGGRKWTATLEGGQVRLAEEGTGRSFSATKIEVRLWEGRVETLDAAKTRGNG